MGREMELRRVPPAEYEQTLEVREEDSSEHSGPGVLSVLHSLLRGRYHWAIMLALLGGALGAAAGYLLPPANYRSPGLIRVKPTVAPILYQNERNGMMPMFDAFMDSQVAQITSQRVIDAAMQSAEWRKLNRGLSPEAVQDFLTNLEVTHPRGSELIYITFTDRDAGAAMTAVRCVIEAYQSLYGENDVESVEQRMKVLEELQARYNAELKSLNDRILSIASEFGSDSLAPIYQFKLESLQVMEAELKQLQMRIATLAGAADGGKNGSATRPGVVTLEQIAALDPQMREYLRERAAQERSLEKLKIRFGEKHAAVRDAQVNLDLLSRDIEQLLQTYMGDGKSGGAIKPLDELRTKERGLRTLYEATREETLALGRKNLQIASLRAEAEDIRSKLDNTRKRIESLNVESTLSGRVSVVSYGDRPLGLYNDRRVALAGAGGAAGAALGVGIILLIGLMDRRLRNVDDTQTALGRSARLLGILPNLPHQLTDSGAASIAAHCVHHIRALLQIQSGGRDERVLTVTSPASGDGKTSVALALGFSYAASGARTLVIDFDLVGGGLSVRMNRAIRRRIGQILCREGLLENDDFHDALKQAQATNRRIGEVLVERNLVTEADVQHALGVQNESVVGLMDALAGEELDNCITGSGTQNLFILPLGSAGPQHVGQLSPASVRRILGEARNRFETVIVDTGPILGSLEAALVAAEADKVVLTVSRGRQRDMVNQAMERLEASGARVAGVVYNRAVPADIVASSSVASVRSVRALTTMVRSNSQGGERIGPIANAVISSVEAPADNAQPAAGQGGRS